MKASTVSVSFDSIASVYKAQTRDALRIALENLLNEYESKKESSRIFRLKEDNEKGYLYLLHEVGTAVHLMAVIRDAHWIDFCLQNNVSPTFWIYRPKGVLFLMVNENNQVVYGY